MTDAPKESPEEFGTTREHEYQDPHYHDEDPDIVNDELTRHEIRTPAAKKKPARRPAPRRRYYDD